MNQRVPPRDRPEDKLPDRPRAAGTRTDLRASPDPTRITKQLLTADESDEGDDDEPLFSDEQPPAPARPRLVEPAVDDSVLEDSVVDDSPLDGDNDDDDDDDDDDSGAFLEGRTVVEAALPSPDGATRVTVTPLSDPAVPAERTIVAPIDLAALQGGAAPTGLAADDDHGSSDFDAPTTLSGEEAPGPGARVGRLSQPHTDPEAGDADDVTTRQPAAPATAGTQTAIAALPPAGPGLQAQVMALIGGLSPAASMLIGFAAASLIAITIALLWAIVR